PSAGRPGCFGKAAGPGIQDSESDELFHLPPMTIRNGQLDFASLRAKLSSSDGRAFWRSLDELAETEGFQEFLYREFPQQADRWVDPVGRRRFLHLMGASLALAGLTGCTKQPEEPIVPYVK